jgi:GTPase Era involved in 16S rRNA processing
MLTTKKSVIDSTRDEIVRLMQLQNENLAELIRSPELFDGADKQTGQQSIDVAKARIFSDDLNNEITKAQDLELVVAVVGTMKAGKSTTINAIVGTEVLPNRSEAMTTLPTAIRHTAGLTEPQLTFTRNKPFNELIAQLAGPYRPELEKLRNPDKGVQVEGVPQDVQALADAFLAGRITPLETRYVGRDAIYGFLHRLNDLVRLADLAKVPQSPLDAYTQIDHFPLIEVEFSHLKSIEGHGNGKFTLLDTPGPNEATRGVALRKVLQEQLRKASAILAVIDYTQRGNDADKELRDFLDGVIEEKADRFYVVVNKFDQRGAHDSSDMGILREQMSGKFGGKVKPTQVFPVSSQCAYYANAALRVLDTHRALPLEEEWVKQFGKLAFGTEKIAARMLPDAEVVRESADDLLKGSLFSELTKPVIQDGYRRAAFMAMHSAISLLMSQSKEITDFLGIRTHAIGQQADALKKLVDGLQGDVEALGVAKTALTRQAEYAGKKLQGTVQQINENTAKGVNAKLVEFFETGKQHTIQANSNLWAKKNENISKSKSKEFVEKCKEKFEEKFEELWRGQNSSNSDEPTLKTQEQPIQFFDPDKPRIVFESEAEAIKFSNSIREVITTITSQSAANTEREFLKALTLLTENMRHEVTEYYLNPIAAKAEAGIKNTLGFSLQIDLSHAPLPRSGALNLVDLDDGLVETETKIIPKSRNVEQSGAWGWLKRKVDFFDNDWGFDRSGYDEKSHHFIVDLKAIQKRVEAGLNSGFKDFVAGMTEHINKKVMPEINTALGRLSTDLESYRGNLLQSIQDKNKSQEEQSKIKEVLERMVQLQKKVHADTLETKTELTAIEQSIELA